MSKSEVELHKLSKYKLKPAVTFLNRNTMRIVPKLRSTFNLQ